MPRPLTQSTGRRKAAVARVRLVAGDGKVIVNRRPIEEYFSSVSSRVHATEPLRVAGRSDRYDVVATIDGGGITGQAGALRLGIARGLVEVDPELRTTLKRAGLLDARRAREGEQEVRPEEGPQGTAVLEALIALELQCRCASGPMASGASPIVS